MIPMSLETAKGLINAQTDFLSYLYSRWNDEKAYEDFTEYRLSISDRFPELTIISYTKRPFGFIVEIDKETRLKISVNSRYVTTQVMRVPPKKTDFKIGDMVFFVAKKGGKRYAGIVKFVTDTMVYVTLDEKHNYTVKVPKSGVFDVTPDMYAAIRAEI